MTQVKLPSLLLVCLIIPIYWFIGLTLNWFILIVCTYSRDIIRFVFYAIFIIIMVIAFCRLCMLFLSDVNVLQWWRIFQMISGDRSERFAFRKLDKGNLWDRLMNGRSEQKIEKSSEVSSTSFKNKRTIQKHTFSSFINRRKDHLCLLISTWHY